MSGGSRALRLLAPLTVTLWLAAGLAWTELTALPPPVEEERTRIELLPKPTPETASAESPKPQERQAEPPKPMRAEPPVAAAEPPAAPTAREAEARLAEARPQEPPTSESAAQAASQPSPIGGAELAVGQRLLAGSSPFPPLSAGYEDFRSFRNYARAMTGLGARFVVIRNRAIVGGADLESGELAPVAAPSSLAVFSPRARNYTGEPALAALTRAARQRYGGGAAIGMLVPRPLDAGLFGGIARALEAQGERPERYREIRGRYEPSAGGARFRVESAVRTDGSQLPLDLLFDLRQIVDVAGTGISGA